MRLVVFCKRLSILFYNEVMKTMIMIYDLTETRYEKQKSQISFNQCGIEFCTPGHSDGPRIRQRILIHFVLDGRGQVKINNNTYTVKAGEAFLIPPNVTASYIADHNTPWKYCWISFYGFEKELCGNMIFGNNVFVKTLKDITKIYSLFLSTIQRMYLTEEELMSKIKSSSKNIFLVKTKAELYQLNAFTYSLLALLLQHTNHTPPKMDTKFYIDKIKTYIDNEYLTIQRINQVAQLFHLHPNYLCCLFKNRYHITPYHYLIEKKMDFAKQLLSKTNNTLEDIAIQCGFSNLSSFGKAYKKYYGVSPKIHRNKTIDTPNS